ncbi:Oar protein [Lysobacter dokdonensis DS-58]|uniref:Oar protein n=1 Tax=Lysobacter dokdonensis DS-58 TaxID=1300345 RepID=A0A0A2WEJ5_9GAMM|nr:TonB-dependent receptor [Lysobacter dokdonensis]KGQ18631.1 Oar protein [Lysobacter dokdonensis DS-58]
MTDRNRVRLSKLSVALIAALAAAPVFAQSTSAGVGGRVVDASGQPVAGAEVTIVHAESGTVSKAVTDANGRYAARGLRVGGPYTVTVNKAETGTKTTNNVYLPLDKVAQVDMSIAPQELAAVTVTGASVIQPDNKGIATTLSREDMDRMPAPDRSIQNIVRADPRIVITDRDRGAFSANGQNFRYNSITVDTVNAGDPFGLNDNGLPTKGTPISQDAIQEYNISTANYDVATRRGVGATINAVTKSGTNEFHGSAYFVYQNASSMVGENASGKKWEGYDKDRTAGITLGGPIVKDKLFFFVSLEKQQKDGIGSITGPAESNATLKVPGISQQFINDVTAAATAKGLTPGDNGQAPDMDTERALVKFDWNINDAHRASLRLSQTTEFEPIVVNGTVTGSSPRLALSSNWYTLDKKSTAYALSFYDDWSDSFSTETSVAYSEFNQDRDPMVGGHQPSILVRTGTTNSGPGIFLGTEPPTHANRLNVKTWNAYFAGSYYLGDHVIKGGVDYQSDELYNLFLQNYNGAYEFNGLTNFVNNQYNRYQLATPAAGYDLNNVAAVLTTKQFGFFVQDTWQVTDRLSVQYGVRYDIPQINDTPTFNPCFAAAPGTTGDLGPCGLRASTTNSNAAVGGYGFSNQGTIDGNDVIQPRASFNFMIDENSQLRGGAGLFVSNTPAVWLGNPFSNNGVAVATYDIGAFNPATPNVTPPFNPNGSTQTPPGVTLVDPGLGTSTMSLAIVDPDFQLPTVAKYTLGYDYQLPFLDSVFTVEAQHIDTIKGIKYDNINLGAPTGVLPDGRLAYQRNPNGTTTGTGGTNQARWNANPSFGQNILLTNTDKGYADNLTFAWKKPFANDWSASISYTISDAKDVNPGTSSVAASSYGNRDWINPNDDYLATSNYSVPQRLLAQFTYEHAFFGEYATRVSALYDGHSGAPYSWVFGNDVNGDSSFRDLAYIPMNRNEISFVNAGQPGGTSQASIDSFFAYIANNDQLVRQQGSIFDRNEGRAPWVNQLDLSFSQEIPGFGEGHKGEIRLDIFNFLNLLNKDWGVEHRASFPLERTLANVSGIDAQGRYVYDIRPYLDGNGNYAPTALPVNENFNPSQRWAANVTLRYEF